MTQTTNGYHDELSGSEETDAVLDPAPRSFHSLVDSRELESYYDPDSGSWSLRIVPSSPPSSLDEG